MTYYYRFRYPRAAFALVSMLLGTTPYPDEGLRQADSAANDGSVALVSGPFPFGRTPICDWASQVGAWRDRAVADNGGRSHGPDPGVCPQLQRAARRVASAKGGSRRTSRIITASEITRRVWDELTDCPPAQRT